MKGNPVKQVQKTLYKKKTSTENAQENNTTKF